jgi:hypothetical protein
MLAEILEEFSILIETCDQPAEVGGCEIGVCCEVSGFGHTEKRIGYQGHNPYFRS